MHWCFSTDARSGYHQVMAGLLADTYIEAHRIAVTNKTEDEEEDQMSEEDFQELIQRENITIERLATSIAPEIYGHLDLKKAYFVISRRRRPKHVRNENQRFHKYLSYGRSGSRQKSVISLHRQNRHKKSIHYRKRFFWRWFDWQPSWRHNHWRDDSGGRSSGSGG